MVNSNNKIENEKTKKKSKRNRKQTEFINKNTIKNRHENHIGACYIYKIENTSL